MGSLQEWSVTHDMVHYDLTPQFKPPAPKEFGGNRRYSLVNLEFDPGQKPFSEETHLSTSVWQGL